MLVRSKIFSQFVEKIKKLELSLSKQHNKMLKIRSEILKIIKNVKIITLGKISQKNFPNPGNPEDFRDPRNFPGSGQFLKNFPLPGKLKIREKGKPYLHWTGGQDN